MCTGWFVHADADLSVALIDWPVTGFVGGQPMFGDGPDEQIPVAEFIECPPDEGAVQFVGLSLRGMPPTHDEVIDAVIRLGWQAPMAAHVAMRVLDQAAAEERYRPGPRLISKIA